MRSAKKNPKLLSGDMELTAHLTELRNRVVICVVLLVLFSIFWLSHSSDLVDLFAEIGTRHGYTFVYISPQELLLQQFKLSLIASLILAFPVILYQLWAFSSPGLSKKESALMFWSLIFGMVCFVCGVLFAYFFMLPLMLRFLIGLSGNTRTVIEASMTIANYLDFLITIFLIFGCVFEMPMLSVILTRAGLIHAGMLKKIRRVVIVLIFLAAAIITPPDIITQFLVAIPMILLYQFSIMLSNIFQRKKA